MMHPKSGQHRNRCWRVQSRNPTRWTPCRTPSRPLFARFTTSYKRPWRWWQRQLLQHCHLSASPHYDVMRAEKLTGPTGLYLLTIADSGERKSTCDGYFTSTSEGMGSKSNARPTSRSWSDTRRITPHGRQSAGEGWSAITQGR
jgi:hypothetical protein